MIGVPKMNGCTSLLDVNLKSCKALTADGLDEFCAHSPPALQKLNLSYTNLKSKCRRLHVVPMLHQLKMHARRSAGYRRQARESSKFELAVVHKFER